MKFLIFIFLFTVPFLANGALVFNEIAWMGSDNGGTSGQNAVDEWVELYNDSPQAVKLEGWIMEIVGSKKISLKGKIAPNGYYLIERKDDYSVPGVPANLITPFGKRGLKNSGSILILRNSGGNEVQKINAQNGWPAGDNSTKETMQWNGSAWITAPPTPRAQNLALPAEQAGLPTSEVGVQEPTKKEEVTESASEPEPKTAIQTPVKKTRGASEPSPVNPSVDLAAGGGAAKEPVVKEAPKESKKNAKQTDELQKTVVQLQREIARLKKDAKKREQEEKTTGIKNENPATETQTANAVSATVGSPAGTTRNFASPANAGGSIWKWLLAVLGLGIFAGIGSIFIRRQDLS